MPRASIDYMNRARDVHRARGTSGGKGNARVRTVESGHHKERKDLLKSIAMIGEWMKRDLLALVHFCRLDNDELREFIEAQFDVIAASL